MKVKDLGIVQQGWYQGQRYAVAGNGTSPGWKLCNLSDGNGFLAQREVPEKFLEAIDGE